MIAPSVILSPIVLAPIAGTLVDFAGPGPALPSAHFPPSTPPACWPVPGLGCEPTEGGPAPIIELRRSAPQSPPPRRQRKVGHPRTGSHCPTLLGSWLHGLGRGRSGRYYRRARGTGYLAWVTKSLAVTTSDLAEAASSDLRAQWRPVIVPTRNEAAQIKSGVWFMDEVFSASLKNVGRGPALYVRMTLDPYGTSPQLWDNASLAPGDTVHLRFHVGEKQIAPIVQILVDYRDLNGRTYSSAIVIHSVTTNQEQTWAYYDVKSFEGALTHHGDSVPQPGLKTLPDATT